MSDQFTETVAATAVVGAEQALETSEQSAVVAEVAAETAGVAIVTSAEATETATVAAETAAAATIAAVSAQETAQSAAETSVATAYATASALDELRNEFAAFRSSFTKPETPPADEAETGELDEPPEEIPTANDFHGEAGETASERKRRHRFGR